MRLDLLDKKKYMLFFFHKKNYMPIYFVYYIYHVHPPKKNYTMCIVISKSYILFCLIKLLYLKTLKNNNVFRKYNAFGFFYYARTMLHKVKVPILNTSFSHFFFVK